MAKKNVKKKGFHFVNLFFWPPKKKPKKEILAISKQQIVKSKKKNFPCFVLISEPKLLLGRGPHMMSCSF